MDKYISILARRIWRHQCTISFVSDRNTDIIYDDVHYNTVAIHFSILDDRAIYDILIDKVLSYTSIKNGERGHHIHYE